MPANPTDVIRTNDPTGGDQFKVYDDTSTAPLKVQAVANDPDVMGRVLSWYSSAASAEETASVSGNPGAVFKADVVLDSSVTADRWLMVFDVVGAPPVGATPILRARVSGGFASIELGIYGREVAAGVSVALSTTPGTLTLPGAGEGYFQVAFI